jgi:hypothetical protein
MLWYNHFGRIENQDSEIKQSIGYKVKLFPSEVLEYFSEYRYIC